MSKQNGNLHAAKKAKNDEFYTMRFDVEEELKVYTTLNPDLFKGKTVFLNCDDDSSEFWIYFKLKFEHLGLKKLVATHYDATEISYKMEISEGSLEEIRTPLSENGDFRSPESIAILQEADFVITNPPFSLFREYVAQLMQYGKQFLIVGSMNAITYKEIFPLIKDNLLWLGVNGLKQFNTPEGDIKKFGNICWFTNLLHNKRNTGIDLRMDISYKGFEEKYPFYDNYNAINVDKVADIPVDYSGVMGVPITFLTNYKPTQFEILGLGVGLGNFTPSKAYKNPKKHMTNGKVVGGKAMNYQLSIKVGVIPSKGTYYTDGSLVMIAPYARILVKFK